MTVPTLRFRRHYRAVLQSIALLAAAGQVAAQAAASAPAAAPPPAAPLPPAAPPPEVDSGDVPSPAARTNALVGGAAMVVGWYGVAAGTSLLWSDAPGADDLFIPVAGPWMALAQTGCPESEPDCSIVEVILRAALTTLSGVGQVGGLAIIGEGVFVPTRERRAAARAVELRASVQPVVAGRDALGVGVVGSF